MNLTFAIRDILMDRMADLAPNEADYFDAMEADTAVLRTRRLQGIPAGTVVLASPDRVEGFTVIGAIHDGKAVFAKVPTDKLQVLRPD